MYSIYPSLFFSLEYHSAYISQIMTYTNKCIQCEKEFDSEKPAKYCSSNCRVTAHRSVTAEPKNVTADVTADIGYGSNDFTREMVEARGESFKPNWYRLGFKSKRDAQEQMGWNKI